MLLQPPSARLSANLPVGNAIVHLSHPSVEGAIHALVPDCIAALRTPFSACALGNPALLVRLYGDITERAVDALCRKVPPAGRERHLRRDQLTRADRLQLVRLPNDKGLFSTRQAANHAAVALGVSRATVYALLKEVTA